VSSRKSDQGQRASRRRKDRAKSTELQSRKQRARSRKDQRRQIIVFAFMGIVAVLLVGTLVWGWYQANVIEPNEPIVVVNGQGVSTSLYQDMVRYQRFQLQQQYLALQQRVQELQSDPDAGFLIQVYQQQMRTLEGSFMELSWRVFERLIDSELVRQNAESLGITIPTDEEVDDEIRRLFGYYTVPPTPGAPTPTHPPYPTPTPIPTPTLAPTATVTTTTTPSPTPTPEGGTPTPTTEPTVTPIPTSVPQEEFDKSFTSWLQAAGLSEGDLREIMRREMLLDRAQRALRSHIPASADQVHIRHIQAVDAAAAKAILERAKAIDFATNPEGFADLAREVSEDAITKDEGGDLGWSLHELLVDDYGPAFADAAFALSKPGDLSGVVEGISVVGDEAGWHIIQLIKRDPNRLIDGDQWDTLWNGALPRWLKQQKETAQIERYWSSDKVPPATGFLGGQPQ